MNVVFLRDCSVTVGHLEYCGDGCCSWMVYESDQVKAGDSIDEWNFPQIANENLVEGIDYKYE